IMEVLADAEMRLRDAASKKILVEVALLKAIEARKATSIDTVLKQLQRLRDGGADESRQAAVPPKNAETAEPRVVPSPPVPAAVGDVALEDLWNRLLESVSRASPFIRSYLVNARALSFQKNVFTIGF